MLYFLFGQDGYRSQEKLLSLREQFLARHPQAEVRSIDAEEMNAISKTLSQSIRGGSLFSPYIFVSVRGLFVLNKADRDEVMDFFVKEYKDNENICVVIREIAPDKRSRLFKMLKKVATETQEHTLLQGMELEKWARDFQEKTYPELTFSRDAWREFLVRAGSDLFHLTSEMEKIALVFGFEKVRVEHVREIMAQSPNSVIFDLLDALAQGNYGHALTVVQDQYKQGNDPYAILGMFAYHARTTTSILSVYEEEGVRDARSIAKVVKAHPFVIEKTLRNQSRFDLERAKNMIHLLARLDLSVKTGKLDPELAVEEVILRA